MALAVVSVGAQGAAAGDLISAKCNQVSREPLYNTDFHWDYTLPELLQRFIDVYTLPKRLGRHAYVDTRSGQIKLPYDTERGGDVTVPLSFIASVRAHIESALRLEYVDAVFFPDMGHSHFLIPQATWESKYRHFESGQMSRQYEQMMADPDLKILYHTAEQLKLLDSQKNLLNDRRLQERFYSRNLVGDNRGEGRLELLQNREHRANTVGEVEGYYWWGAGFNVSANKDGCFVYNDRGVERYFDLSLYDLEPAPGQTTYDRPLTHEAKAKPWSAADQIIQ